MLALKDALGGLIARLRSWFSSVSPRAEQLALELESSNLSDEQKERMREALARADLTLVEATLLNGGSVAYLTHRFRNIREELDALGAVVPSDPADAMVPPDLEPLREKVRVEAAHLARVRFARAALGRMRTIVCSVGLLTVFVFFIAGGFFSGFFSNGDEALQKKVEGMSVTVLIPLLGALGGFISGMGRLYRIPWRGPLLYLPGSTYQVGASALLNLFLAALEGAVFAVAFYILMAAGLLAGSVFPAFDYSIASDVYEDFVLGQFFYGSPATPADIGKALAWAFAAGFSERLVPDTYSQLEAMATISAKAASNDSGK